MIMMTKGYGMLCRIASKIEFQKTFLSSLIDEFNRIYDKRKENDSRP